MKRVVLALVVFGACIIVGTLEYRQCGLVWNEKRSCCPLAPIIQGQPSAAKDSMPPESDPSISNALRVIIVSEPTSRRLSVLMGDGDRKDYIARIQETRRLQGPLSEGETQSLYSLLDRKDGQDALKPAQLNALKNDVVNVLRTQPEVPRLLAHNLMAMYHDPLHDNVWRDYCVQHLGGLYERVGDPAQKRAVEALLWRATEETKLGIAGTALLALSHNTKDGVDAGRVAARARSLCEDPQCGELAKITALQVCARLKDRGVLPAARSIAGSTANVPLRMSAIAALGALGDATDRAMVEQYAKSTDIRLRKSAQAALARLP